MDTLIVVAVTVSAFLGLAAGFLVTHYLSERSRSEQQRILYHAFLDEMYRRLELERKFKQNTIQVVTPKRSNKIQIIRKAE